jgi:hypothetical protein
MPVVFGYKGYRFFFYSNEGDPREPLHIHVRKAQSVAKFRLDPEPGISEAYGFTSSELRELLEVAIENTAAIRRYWNEHFNI